MSNAVLIKIARDRVLRDTVLVALIADSLLLLPFFFTSNLFSKILPSGNISSLAILLVFSLLALQLSKTYERYRTAGLLLIRRRILHVLAPQEGVLLFARGRDVSANIKLLQSIFISLRSGEFVALAGAALQVFFPIAVLVLLTFVSWKLFAMVLVFLLIYGISFQNVVQPRRNDGSQEDRIARIRSSWFYRWKEPKERLQYFNLKTKNPPSPWTQAATMANLNSFRYSASLVLLGLAAFLIIEDNLPTGYLLPISFFSQRLLMPAERIRQISLIYKIFTFAAVNRRSAKMVPPPPVTGRALALTSDGTPMDKPAVKVDGLRFSGPLAIAAGPVTLRLADPLDIGAGEMLVVSGAAGQGKTALLEAVLGLLPIQTGRIDLKTRHDRPWDLIRYLNQHESLYEPEKRSFYLARLNDLERVLHQCQGLLIVIDDPMMGMDGRGRLRVLELIVAAKQAGALLVVASNDRQLVEQSAHWITIDEQGQLLVRKKDGTS